jgi:hypothetical protein
LFCSNSPARQLEELLHRAPNSQAEFLPRRPVDTYYSHNRPDDHGSSHNPEFKFSFEETPTSQKENTGVDFRLQHMPSIPSIKSRQLKQVVESVENGTYEAIISSSSTAASQTVLTTREIETELRAERKRQKESEATETAHDWKRRLRVKVRNCPSSTLLTVVTNAAYPPPAPPPVMLLGQLHLSYPLCNPAFIYADPIDPLRSLF